MLRSSPQTVSILSPSLSPVELAMLLKMCASVCVVLTQGLELGSLLAELLRETCPCTSSSQLTDSCARLERLCARCQHGGDRQARKTLHTRGVRQVAARARKPRES
jgi:hypothetical protein